MATWFKPRRYGYGATPVTWQGWALTAGAVLLVFASAWLLIGVDRASPPTAGNVVLFLGVDVVVVAVLWFVSQRTTAGEWRWRWGTQDRDKTGNRT